MLNSPVHAVHITILSTSSCPVYVIDTVPSIEESDSLNDLTIVSNIVLDYRGCMMRSMTGEEIA